MTRSSGLTIPRPRPGLGVALVLVGALVTVTPRSGPPAGAGTPSAPADVVATTTWHWDGADVAWDPPAGAAASPITRYLVDVSTDDGTTWTAAGWTTTARGTFPCGSSGQHCIFRVSAEGTAGVGAPSLASNAVLVPDPPFPPSSPERIGAVLAEVNSYGDETYTVSWSPPGSPGGVVDHYVVVMCTNQGCDDPNRWSGGTTTTATSIELDIEGDAQVSVFAVNSYGYSPSADVTIDV